MTEAKHDLTQPETKDEPPDDLLMNEVQSGGRATHHVFRRGALRSATGPLGDVARAVPSFCSRGSFGSFREFDPSDGLPDDVDPDHVCKDCAHQIFQRYGVELVENASNPYRGDR